MVFCFVVENADFKTVGVRCSSEKDCTGCDDEIRREKKCSWEFCGCHFLFFFFFELWVVAKCKATRCEVEWERLGSAKTPDLLLCHEECQTKRKKNMKMGPGGWKWQ